MKLGRKKFSLHDEPVIRPTRVYSYCPERPLGRVSGVGGSVIHAYRCPLHGLIDVEVPRRDVPDVVSCPEQSWNVIGEDKEYPTFELASQGRMVSLSAQRCGDDAYWAGSFCGQGKSAGDVSS